MNMIVGTVSVWDDNGYGLVIVTVVGDSHVTPIKPALVTKIW